LILATTTVEDFDRFLNIFSTKGAEKRKQYRSKGATVFRDPNEDDRVWVLYDWDEGGLKKSRAGRRKVPIAGILRDHLAEHRVRSGRQASDLIFGRTPNALHPQPAPAACG
jgi:hypothetical protein